jgi:hypothetical protein
LYIVVLVLVRTEFAAIDGVVKAKVTPALLAIKHAIAKVRDEHNFIILIVVGV